MDQAVAGWVRLAERDIRSARVLLENGDPENALFLCQQAIEKALKAHVQVTTDDPPPRIHNLMKLAQVAGLWDSLDEHRQQVLLAVDPHVTAGRYAAANSTAGRTVSHAEALGLIDSAGEVVEWLLAGLK